MKIFYNAENNGFYDEAVHGTRIVEVPDPSWVRPTKLVHQPDWEPPADDLLAAAPLVKVFDDEAVHPLISVANANCKIPLDAVEISREEHQELLAAQATGMAIVADKKGKPKVVERPGPSAEELRATLIARAKVALTKSDIVVLRAFEDGKAVPDKWSGYRAALRNIINGSSAAEALPEQPSFV